MNRELYECTKWTYIRQSIANTIIDSDLLIVFCNSFLYRLSTLTMASKKKFSQKVNNNINNNNTYIFFCYRSMVILLLILFLLQQQVVVTFLNHLVSIIVNHKL